STFVDTLCPLPDPSPEANRLIWPIGSKRALRGVEHARLEQVQLHLLARGMLLSMSARFDTRSVLDAWNLGGVMSSRMPATGSIHQTLLLQATTGDYVLRA